MSKPLKPAGRQPSEPKLLSRCSKDSHHRCKGFLDPELWYNISVALERQTLKPIEVARKAVEIASDKQANNIVVLDIREVSSFADYFVICSGDSDRQLDAIWQEINEKLQQEGVAPYRIEGTADSGWIVIDLGDVVVHIFSRALREYYRLEELWHEATPVLKIQ